MAVDNRGGIVNERHHRGHAVRTEIHLATAHRGGRNETAAARQNERVKALVPCLQANRTVRIHRRRRADQTILVDGQTGQGHVAPIGEDRPAVRHFAALGQRDRESANIRVIIDVEEHLVVLGREQSLPATSRDADLSRVFDLAADQDDPAVLARRDRGPAFHDDFGRLTAARIAERGLEVGSRNPGDVEGFTRLVRDIQRRGDQRVYVDFRTAFEHDAILVDQNDLAIRLQGTVNA